MTSLNCTSYLVTSAEVAKVCPDICLVFWSVPLRPGALSDEAFWNNQCQPKVRPKRSHIEMVSTNSFSAFFPYFWSKPLFIRPRYRLAHLLYLMNTSCKVTVMSKTTSETKWSNNLTLHLFACDLSFCYKKRPKWNATHNFLTTNPTDISAKLLDSSVFSSFAILAPKPKGKGGAAGAAA